MIELKHSTLLLMTAAVCATTEVLAASIPGYPTRPIRLLLPFAPGGSADVIGRIIAPRLSEAMGQQWVVDNRGGAAGNIAAELFQKRSGIEMVHVPYKSGGASAAAVLSGETQFGVSSIASSLQLVKAGRLRAAGIKAE